MRRGREPGGRRGVTPAAALTGRWIVALPAWGERCVDVLVRHTLPALLEALRALDKPAVLMVWTDQRDRVVVSPSENPSVVELKFLDIPGPDSAFESMSSCHREALAAAGGGDRVLLLTADMVLSREVLATCEAQIAGGKQVVCCVAMRALEGDAPIGASGRVLLDWAWEHRHPMTRECTWPEGRSYDVWRMYFEQGGEVAARVFLPHPLVVVPAGRQMVFRPTIDVNLTTNFSQQQTYMITSPEEGAAIELSPPDKDFNRTTTMRERAESATVMPSCPALMKCTNSRHRMFWGKKVVIRGAGGDCGDGEVVRRVLG